MKQKLHVTLALSGLAFFALACWAWAQPDFDRGRSLVERTDHDLRKVEHLDRFSAKDHERYDNALRHLSEFDSGLSRGKYDHGKLDAAIDDLNNVCRNNILSPGDRDMLQADLRDLRELRADWR
ncbi:MAG: hypothetical protein ABSB35_29635 [Bryobacteraceae bacterium]|jgi:hypothetical protein